MTPGLPTLLGVPYDAASSFRRGAAGAPAIIRRALASEAGNSWSERLVELVPGRTYADAGDLALGGQAAPLERIEEAVRELVRSSARPLLLGGDHSITWPVVRAIRERSPRLSILHLDAHNDLYDAFEGDRASHACPFARIMEEGLVDQLVQVGIRAMTGHQRAQADRFGVEVIDMAAWSAGRRPVLRHPAYISLDMDVLDPAFAPGVSHREPGGLSVRDVIVVLQAVTVPLVGADLVELNPDCDVDGLTATVAGKLVKELMSAMHLAPQLGQGG